MRIIRVSIIPSIPAAFLFIIGTLLCTHRSAADEKNLQIMPQMGQVGTVAALSPDGRYILSPEGQTDMLLWDVATGKVMRQFRGHTQSINCIAFSSDGRSAASVSADSTVMLWDVVTGKAIRVFKGHASDVRGVAFAPDGKTILSGSEDGILKYWDVATGNELRSIPEARCILTYIIAFSPDSKYALTSSYQTVIDLWDLAAGTMVRSFSGHAKTVTSATFSADGKYILSGAEDNLLKLWDVASGTEVRTYAGHRPTEYGQGGIKSAAFSPDGKTIFSVGVDKQVKSWDAASGRELASFPVGTVISAVLSPAKNYALLDYELWDIKAQKKIRTLSCASGRSVNSLAFSPDGKSIVCGLSGSYPLRVFDLEQAKTVMLFEGQYPDVMSTAVSPDGTHLISGARVNTVKLWDVHSDTAVYTLSGMRDYNISTEALMRDREFSADAAAFSPDGKTALSGSSDKSLTLWDAATGTALNRLPGVTKPVLAAGFSPDGRYIAAALGGTSFIGSGDEDVYPRKNNLLMWDAASGRPLTRLSTHPLGVASFAFSPNGRLLASGTVDGQIVLWNLPRGHIEKTLSGHTQLVTSVAFSHDGKFILSGSEDQTVDLWDAASGALLRTFTGQCGCITAVAFSPDGKFALSGSQDGSMRLWDVAGQGYVAYLAGSNANDWLLYTDDGYWDSSARGNELVAMVSEMNCWNIDQFAVKNNRPDIILRRLGSGDSALIAHYYSKHLRRLQKAGLSESQLSTDHHVPVAEILSAQQREKLADVSIRVSDSQYAIRHYNIYVNGVALLGAGKKVGGKNAVVRETIELTGGQNKIEVSCTNAMGIESYRTGVMLEFVKPVERNLYYLGFGVSKYKNSSYNLRYADKDADDLGKFLAKMKDTNSFANVFVKTYVNENVTPENIKAAKGFLKRAKPDDTFILFVAGHGMHDRDADATFYYLTYNANVKNLPATAADFESIEDLLSGIAPRNKLLLIDACESGEIDEPLEDARLAAMADARGIKSRGMRVAPNSADKAPAQPRRDFFLDKDRFIYHDLQRRTGAIIFASSRGSEFSYESDEIKNGFFTQSIMRALDVAGFYRYRNAVASDAEVEKYDADKNHDGFITVDELKNNVGMDVSVRTQKLQNPTIDRDNVYAPFRLPMVGR
jgi:WD40 repeat protein